MALEKQIKRVRKAVIPAAGWGTRFLPATKAVPKEMLPVADKPLIQYAIEEAVAAGCDEVIIVTSRGKTSIEDHFDRSLELEALLAERNKRALLESIKATSQLAKISYTRQSQALGLGHAVLQAKELVGDEPFAVLLPDDIVDAPIPCIGQLIRSFEDTGCTTLAATLVPLASISAYGCLDCAVDSNDPLRLAVRDLIEKPAPEVAPSCHAVIGRYVLTPRIFGMLESLTPGSGGELQLTDAIKALLAYEKVYGYSFKGIRHDAGDKVGFLKANVHFAMARPEYRDQILGWIKQQDY